MNEETPRRPRTWVLWVARTTATLTVLNLIGGSIAANFLGMGKIETEGSLWWLAFGMPQVSVALLAVLICWDPDTRPDGLWLITTWLNMAGLLGALAFLAWLPAVIGVLTIIALKLWPKGRLFIQQTPAGWPRL